VGVNKRGIYNATNMCPPSAIGPTDIDISTWLKIFDILLKTEKFDILLKTEKFVCAALLLYSANELSCRLPFAIYLKSVWSLDVHESSVDKLAHSDKDSADD